MDDQARQDLVGRIFAQVLDDLDVINTEDGPPDRFFLACVYAYEIEGETIYGWPSTPDSTFITAGLLREIAEQITIRGRDELAD